MSTEKSFANKIKEHPVAVVFALIGAAIAGLASVTQSLETVSKQVRCIPIHLGLSDGYKGKGVLKYSVQTFDWVSIGTAKKTKGTGNHACLSNCRGEPTRTNYEINLTVDDYKTPSPGDRKLKTPDLSCKSGPCGGWNQILDVGLAADGKSAKASFDVWSNPTSWELTAELLEYRVASEKIVEKDIAIGPEPLLEIVVPSNAVSARFSGSMEDNLPFSVELGKKAENCVVEFKSLSKRNGNAEYSYIILDKRCG